METWSGAMSTSWCATKVCDGSVADVATLLEAYRSSGARFTSPGAALELGGDVDPGAGVTPMAPRRVHAARVRYVRWLPAARVTVEVDPWSQQRSEVLIRPVGRLPVARERFLDATVALVNALVAELARAQVVAEGADRDRANRLPRAS